MPPVSNSPVICQTGGELMLPMKVPQPPPPRKTSSSKSQHSARGLLTRRNNSDGQDAGAKKSYLQIYKKMKQREKEVKKQ